MITPNSIAPTDASAATCPPIANIMKYKTIGDNTGNKEGIAHNEKMRGFKLPHQSPLKKKGEKCSLWIYTSSRS